MLQSSRQEKCESFKYDDTLQRKRYALASLCVSYKAISQPLLEYEERFSFFLTSCLAAERMPIRNENKPGSSTVKRNGGTERANMANDKDTKKNYAKRDSYALAFKMIDAALKYGCPLQAITIEESILTDRLSSTLNVNKERVKPFDTLGMVLTAWKRGLNGDSRYANARLFDNKMNSLYLQLDDWRKKRNALLHGLAKSTQGEGPEIPADEFMAQAIQVAEIGLGLANTVKNWVQAKISKSRKVGKK